MVRSGVRKEGDIDGQRSARGRELVSGSRGASERGIAFTIGHSNHSAEKFVGLLKEHGIEVVADVRSQPYSRHAPHFNAKYIETILLKNGIGRMFLGSKLGGRPTTEEFYDEDGRVNYARIERSCPFLDGIQHLERGIQHRRIALLCSEEDPGGCHRRLLIGRVLVERGLSVRHIRGDGSVQTEGETSDGQPVLFPDLEVSVRRSIRSVSRKRRRPSSSGR